MHNLYEGQESDNIEQDEIDQNKKRGRKSEFYSQKEIKFTDDNNVTPNGRRGSKLPPPVKRRITINNNTARRSSEVDFSKRRTAFMQNNLKFKTYLQKTDEEMDKSINHMPFSKYE